MSKLNFKDYAGYYIGCKCLNTWFPEGDKPREYNWVLSGFRTDSEKHYLLENDSHFTWTDSIKPILRNLSDITEGELKEMIVKLSLFDLSNCEFEYDQNWVNAIKNGVVIDCLSLEENGQIEMMKTTPATNPQSEAFHYLLKKGFDLFSLISNSLAIDSNTLK